MNRFSHLKTFVQDHRIEIGFATGVCVGFAILMITKQSASPNVIKRVALTPEQLKGLLASPESVVTFNSNPKEMIWVLNSTTKEVFP